MPIVKKDKEKGSKRTPKKASKAPKATKVASTGTPRPRLGIAAAARAFAANKKDGVRIVDIAKAVAAKLSLEYKRVHVAVVAHIYGNGKTWKKVGKGTFVLKDQK